MVHLWSKWKRYRAVHVNQIHLSLQKTLHAVRYSLPFQSKEKLKTRFIFTTKAGKEIWLLLCSVFLSLCASLLKTERDHIFLWKREEPQSLSWILGITIMEDRCLLRGKEWDGLVPEVCVRDATVQLSLETLHSICASPLQSHELASDKSKHTSVNVRLFLRFQKTAHLN